MEDNLDIHLEKITQRKAPLKDHIQSTCMGNEIETYSMFLGRPWLKHVKENHNWGDSSLTITTTKRTTTMNTIKKIPLNHKRDKNMSMVTIGNRNYRMKRRNNYIMWCLSCGL